MGIWSRCIERPVMTSVFSLFLLLFGVIGYQELSVRELPDVDFPIVSIRTAYKGASAEIIDKKVTEEIERQVSSIEGVKSISSLSRESESLVTVEFHLDRPIDSAAQDVRDRVARARLFLPAEAKEPSVEKFDLNAFAIVWLAMSFENDLPGAQSRELELSEIARDTVRPSLEGLVGVGSILIGGEKRKALRVEVDPRQMAAHGVSYQELKLALLSQNIEPAAGRFEGKMREYSVEVKAKPANVAEFSELIIGTYGGKFVRIGDVAQVYEGVENERTLARFNGKSAVGIGVIKQAKANTVEVAHAVKEQVKNIILPEGVKIEMAFDSSIFVEDSIEEVKNSLIFSALLVLVIIYLFLGRAQITLIPAIVMPISIVGTYGCMAFLGFSLNNFTLLALILSIGVVVDDAIVILENSVRHLKDRNKSRNNTEQVHVSISSTVDKATNQVAVAVIATSVALIAVFLPVALVEGQIGRFFYEFGVTVCLSIAISTLVALTLTPMLCAHFLNDKVIHTSGLLEAWMQRLQNLYKQLLVKLFIYPKTVLALSFSLTALISILLVALLGKEFMPTGDRGSFIIELTAPQGSTLDYSAQQLSQVEEMLSERAEVASYFGAVALAQGGAGQVSKAIVFTRLHSIKEKARLDQETILKQLRAQFQNIPGVEITAMGMSPFSRGQSNQPFQLILSSSQYDLLLQSTEKVKNVLQKVKGFTGLQDDLLLNAPQVFLEFDKDRLWEQGVSITEISSALLAYLAGEKVGDYESSGKRYDLVIQMPSHLRGSPKELLENLQVRNAEGAFIDLSSLVSLRVGAGPSEIKRFDKKRSVTFSAGITGRALGEITEEVRSKLQEILPSDASTVNWKFKGDTEQMQESLGSLVTAFFLGILVIYLVLCAQLESVLAPFVIMCSVPFSIVGALLGLLVFNMTLNIYSMIGMIMLIGLVTKNAILLVDYAQVLQLEGYSDREAIFKSSLTRLRPILMTAISTLVGILPIALSFGPGAMMRRPLGIAVACGMSSALLLTLIVIPVLYLVVCRLRKAFVNL